MKLEEFKESDFILYDHNHYMEYSCGDYFIEIWGQEWTINIDISCAKDESERVKGKISLYLESCKKHLQWIDENKDKFIRALLESGMAETAKTWAENETVTRDGKVYCVLVDDGEIETPLTEERFIGCLGGGAASLSIDAKDDDNFLYDIFFSTEPNLFAYHSIEVFLEVDADCDYKIKVHGLAG